MGAQVPVQLPLPRASRAMGESPLLKLTVTLPVLTLEPQSSTTCIWMALGHPATVVNPVPMLVKTGRSLLGAQGAAVARGESGAEKDPAAAEMTRSRSTDWELPSPKASLMAPRYTPAARPLVAGVIVMVADWPAAMLAD